MSVDRLLFQNAIKQKTNSFVNQAAGTICLQEKWWRASTFPTELMRDCVSTRDGLLMHTKIILVRHKISPEAGTNEKLAWAYVGSANLSESAW